MSMPSPNDEAEDSVIARDPTTDPTPDSTPHPTALDHDQTPQDLPIPDPTLDPTLPSTFRASTQAAGIIETACLFCPICSGHFTPSFDVPAGVPIFHDMGTSAGMQQLLVAEDYGQGLALPHYGHIRPSVDFFQSNLEVQLLISHDRTIGLNRAHLPLRGHSHMLPDRVYHAWR
jgi:hypothetical protein